MKIKNRSMTKKRKFIIVILLFVFLAGLTGGIWAFSKNTSNNEQGNPKNNPTKNKRTSSSEDNNTKDSHAKVVLPDTSSGASQTILEKPNITRTEQTGDFIRVSAIFSEASTGNCRLKMTQAGQSPIESVVNIVVGPSYYVCNGFRVPLAELSSNGAWRIIVVHELDGRTSNSEERIINVQ